jgi:acetyl-CoA acetyltransferase
MVSSLRGAAAVVGIGQLPWYKRGTSPDDETKMAMKATILAAEDAGVNVRDIDGLVSWGSEKNGAQNMMRGLGTRELRYAALVWTHGGGSAGAIGLAATAIATGQANYVAVVRAMAEKGADTRLRVVVAQGFGTAFGRVHGMGSPAQGFSMRASRIMEHDGLSPDAVWALVGASYLHGSRNPDAYAYKNDLDRGAYDKSRSPAEPLHLFDNSRENDGAVVLLLTSAERAKDLRRKPAYVLSSPTGRLGGADFHDRVDPEGRTTSGFRAVAERCWRESGYTPGDVDVAQIYTNASTSAAVALIDHGFCTWADVNEFMTIENLTAPGGRLPINTAGGDLAEGFLHGAGNNAEAVRQIRGTSPNQVPDARLSLTCGGPSDTLVSTTLLGSEETL